MGSGEVFWNAEKNFSKTYGKKDLVWLFCSQSHEWQTSKASYDNGRGCPYCAGQRVLTGENDLESVHPIIASQWHPTRNGSFSPSNVFAKSNKKVWWVCEKDHEWQCSIKHRILSGVTCNICSNRVVLEGYNDLETIYPHVATEWNSEKNTLLASEVTFGSHKKVWWVCSKGHEWESKIVERTHNKGKGCPVCSGKKVITQFNDAATLFPALIYEWHSTKNGSAQLKDYTAGSNKKVWWQCERGHEWKATVADRTSGHGCKSCKRSHSEPEETLSAFFNSSNLKFERNVKLFKSRHEVDFYFAEKKVAVEFNGVYWHDEHHKPQNYHYDKWKACKKQGIQLIQIWEDDWNYNPELVKRMLAHKLGVMTKRKVFARNTVMKSITQEETNEFLNEYHIQGRVDGSIRVGLFEKITVQKPFREKLVSVMVLKREPGAENTLNLLRFATAEQVVGGFTKLLKHVEKQYTPESVITFSDNTVSDGGLYEKHGFENVRELKPDYMYVVKGERVHKFNYRLKRFREDPELEYDEKLSERELALLNNIPRIWDAGKTKWVLYLN